MVSDRLSSTIVLKMILLPHRDTGLSMFVKDIVWQHFLVLTAECVCLVPAGISCY